MNPVFEPLVAELREELAGYGGLLKLFDEQQGHLWQREPLRVVDTAREIEELANSTAAHRATREGWVRDFARAHGQAADAPLRELLPLFPADLRLLLEALVQEINHLVRRVRERARQNQSLLARAVELQREAVATLRPDAMTRTYAPSGRATALAEMASSLRVAG